MVPTHDWLTDDLTPAPTLDEIVAEFAAQQAAEHAARQSDAEAKAAAAQAKRDEERDDFQHTFESAVSSTLRAALGDITYVSGEYTGDNPKAQFAAYGHTFFVYRNVDAWRLYACDRDGDEVNHWRTFGDNVEAQIIEAVTWARQFATDSTPEDTGATETPRELAVKVAGPPAIQPTLIHEGYGRKTYLISAQTRCGSLSQFTAVAAEIGENGFLSIAFMDGNNRRRTRAFEIDGQTMQALLPLLNAAANAKQADKAVSADDDSAF